MIQELWFTWWMTIRPRVKAWQRLIRSAGLMAKTFASAEEFLAAPRPKMPSCLVLDVSLPGVSGLDLQQELAKSGVQIPIIFLTATATSQ